MAKKFAELRSTMSPESQARSSARAEAMLEEFHTPQHGGELMAWEPVGKEVIDMRTYRVTMYVEANGEPEDDPVIEKIVEASNKHAALDLAKKRVRDENPEFNYIKIWAWTVESLAASPEP